MTVSTREFLDADDTPESPVPEGSGEDYALVIGVNDYPKLRPLHGAIADAQAFADWLMSEDGGRVPATNVHTIVSTPDPLAPIGHEINDALEDILERAKETGGHRFYFYFSGHGCVGDRASDISLCMANWSELRRRAALSSDAWLDVVVRSGAFAEVAFFLDCCRVWAVRAVGLPPHIDFTRPVERDESTRVFVAYAAEFQRVAVESLGGGSSEVHGIFTSVLINGLQGEAAASDGIVTADSLKRHLEHGVKAEARLKGLRQGAEVRNGLEAPARFGARATKPPRNYTRKPPTSCMGTPAYIPPEYVQRHSDTSPLTRTGEYVTPSSIELPMPLTPWLPTRLRETAQMWLPGTTDWLHQLPSSTHQETTQGSYSGRISVILFDNGLSGIGWSLHGQGIDIAFNEATTWRDGAHGTLFSARLTPGIYTLRWARQREFVLHVFSEYDTQIAVDYFEGVVQFASIRTFLLPNETIPKAPTREFASEVETGLGCLHGPSEVIAKILAGNPFDNPLLGLLAAYQLTRTRAPDADRMDAIISRIESMLGPCADIHALRLYTIIIRGADLPTRSFSEPPMFRDGLLAFVEASHRRPETVESGSLLEHACVHRLVDSPLSSCFVPRKSSTSEPDWLQIAVAEAMIQKQDRNQTTSALEIAKQLGVPTLAVQARLCFDTSECLDLVRRSDQLISSEYSRAHLDNTALRSQIKAYMKARDYAGALSLAESHLLDKPEEKSVRQLAEICRQKLEPPVYLVPQIMISRKEAPVLDDLSIRFLREIDGELPIEDVIEAYANGPIDIIMAMQVLQNLVKQGVVEIVRVPAQPV